MSLLLNLSHSAFILFLLYISYTFYFGFQKVPLELVFRSIEFRFNEIECALCLTDWFSNKVNPKACQSLLFIRENYLEGLEINDLFIDCFAVFLLTCGVPTGKAVKVKYWEKWIRQTSKFDIKLSLLKKNYIQRSVLYLKGI